MKAKIAIMVAGALMASATVSHALSITPGSSFLINTGTDGIPPDSTGPGNPESALISTYGAPIVYKSNLNTGEESFSFVDNYSTVYSPSVDPSGATISHDGGASLGIFSSIYLLVKDGNVEPYWYFFDLGAGGANWNGTEDLVLSEFWPNRGSISHLTLFADGQGERVPDGAGTVALLGMALMGLGGVRRFLAKA